MGTQYWFIRHPFKWYENHPTIIGYSEEFLMNTKNRETFCSIEQGDKIVYYSHEAPKGIVGIFRIISDRHKNNSLGEMCYDISPLFKFDKPKTWVAKKVVGECLKPRGGVFELKPEQYRKIKSFVLGMDDEPTNEQEVVGLFSKIHQYLGFTNIRLQQFYPDANALDKKGKGQRIEFKFESKKFKYPPEGCDFIVCWKDNLVDRPKKVEIIGLQSLYGSER